jgi:hypothetical protein
VNALNPVAGEAPLLHIVMQADRRNCAPVPRDRFRCFGKDRYYGLVMKARGGCRT